MKLKKNQWYTMTAIMDIDKKGNQDRLVRLFIDGDEVMQQQPRSEMVVDDYEEMVGEIENLALSLWKIRCEWPIMNINYRDWEALALQSFFELGWQE